MAVILTLQMTGCNTGTKEQDTTAENKTQSSIKDLFNSGRNDKEDGKESADDERESAEDDKDTESGEREADGEDEDDEVRYQDDYYEFVNQNLLSKIELAPTDAHWDWFGELNAVVSGEMEEIIDELASDGKTYEKGSSEQKIKDMYECVTNIENRNETGLGPLKPHMDSIRNAGTIGEYVQYRRRLQYHAG